jgi:hypothetical protein
MGLTGDELAAFVEASCRRQGVPVKVDDVRVVDQVVTLLRGGPPGCGRQPAPDGPHRSESPDDLDPAGINFVGSLGARGDDDVVHDRLHDGGLAGEVQV